MGRLAEALKRVGQDLGQSTTEVDLPFANGDAADVLDDAPKENEPALEEASEAVALTEGRRDPATRRQHGVTDKLVGTPDLPPGPVEQYRKLAATLHHAQVERGIKVVMVASAMSGEGKTLTSTNLSLTLSKSYRRRVLMIDADLRHPALHDVFGVPNIFGLNDSLKLAGDHKLSLIQLAPRLSLLPAGGPDPDPVSGLTSERLRRVIDEAAERFDWVVIDTAPVALLPDTNLLAAMVDAVVLVIQAGRTPYDLVNRAIEAIGRGRIIGVVLNRVDESAVPAAHGYYDYYKENGDG